MPSTTAAEPTPTRVDGASARRVMRELLRAAWRQRSRTVLALSLLVAAKLAAVAVPLILKRIVDDLGAGATAAGGLAPHALRLPVLLLLAYALVRFSSTLFTELRDLVFARVTQRTVMHYAEATFAQLMRLSAQFHARRSTGTLIREIERGTAGIGFLLGTGLFTLVPTMIEFGAVVAIMASGYSIEFTGVILTTFLVYGAWTTTLTQRRSLRQRRVNAMDARASGRLVDTLINVETVRAYAGEALERERYARLLDDWIDESVSNQKALSMLHIGQGAIIGLGVACVMLLAGYQTVHGTMTVGDLVLVNSYVIQVCLPLNALGFVFREAKDALVNTELLFGLLHRRPEVVEAPGAVPLQVRGGEVRFDHVSFGYEPGRQVLHDVDFTIPPGHTLAVVGGSGSGKSTLARLLMRFHDVQQGRVAIDGQDVRDLTFASLRAAIGLVPQDTVLFNDTVGWNLRYGRPDATREQMVEAARAAQLHELIATLPEGYETPVGERGARLSGGERQRLAIARALLKDPPIVILDEATSALDTRAERAIQGELDRVAQGRTTLVIAHRLSTIVHADQILVLERGRVIERGRHDDLLAADGAYAQLWRLQRQRREADRSNGEHVPGTPETSTPRTERHA